VGGGKTVWYVVGHDLPVITDLPVLVLPGELLHAPGDGAPGPLSVSRQ
jgi:hypothetical protein